jgi:hypothetical protein
MLPLRTSPAVEEALDELRARLLRGLGDDLVGLYAYGSLVLGDFDPERSDLDLLAALSSEVGEKELEALRRAHVGFLRRHPAWEDRVEVACVPTSALRTFKSRASTVAIVSPGEPLHLKQVGRDWLIDYHLVREHGIALFGPPPRTLIEDISRDELLEAVRGHLARWHGELPSSATRGPQRYAVLTMCRGLYTLRHGRHVSKREAATWARRELPEWAPAIGRALAAANDDPASDADRLETARFVEFALRAAQEA